ncbi:MAG: hypothetical protein ABJE47_21120 [bacterium]
MRAALAGAILPFMAWLGALQAGSSRGVSIEDSVRYVGLASVLGSLTVLVYRLGVWRQEMENTKHTVGADVRAYHAEAMANFEKLGHRLDTLEELVGASSGRSRRGAWSSEGQGRGAA